MDLHNATFYTVPSANRSRNSVTSQLFQVSVARVVGGLRAGL